MRIGTIDGAPVLIQGDRVCALGPASDGLFAISRDIFENWTAFTGWAGRADDLRWQRLADDTIIGPPVDSPRQVFGVGLNYGEHRDEVAVAEGYTEVGLPLTFTKFPSSITGPTGEIQLSSDRCDYEIEIVAVVGRRADRIAPAEGWAHVAGLTIGQDISDRGLQYASPNQLSLGKSMRTFSPIGPLVVTPDEFPDRDDIAFECHVNGELRQKSTTAMLIRDIGATISFLSRFTQLLPGDLVFTGTPTGIGHRREPPVFLRPGDIVTSTVDGIGVMENRCVDGFKPVLDEL